MSKKLTIANRNKYKGVHFSISRDHEINGIHTKENNFGAHNAVYVEFQGNYGKSAWAGMTTTEARAAGQALIEAADEFDEAVEEASRVKGDEFVKSLPIGARFRWATQHEGQYWIKVADNVHYLYGNQGLNNTPLKDSNFTWYDDLEVVE